MFTSTRFNLSFASVRSVLDQTVKTSVTLRVIVTEIYEVLKCSLLHDSSVFNILRSIFLVVELRALAVLLGKYRPSIQR